MIGWTANSGEYGEGGELELAQRVSTLVGSITQMDASLRSAVDTVGSIQPGEQPPGFAFDQWRLAPLLYEYEAARAQRTTVGDVGMALAGWVPSLEQHLKLFSAPA